MVHRTIPVMIVTSIIATITGALSGAIDVRKRPVWTVIRVNVFFVEPVPTFFVDIVEIYQIVLIAVNHDVRNARGMVFALVVERRHFNAGTRTCPFLTTKTDQA